MKTLFSKTNLIILVFLIFVSNNIFAQKDEEQKTVKMHITKVVNGETTTFDTTFVVDGNHDEHFIFDGKEEFELPECIDGENIEITTDIQFEGDFDDEEIKKIVVIDKCEDGKMSNQIYLDDEILQIPEIETIEKEDGTQIITIKKTVGDEVQIEEIELPNLEELEDLQNIISLKITDDFIFDDNFSFDDEEMNIIINSNCESDLENLEEILDKLENNEDFEITQDIEYDIAGKKAKKIISIVVEMEIEEAELKNLEQNGIKTELSSENKLLNIEEVKIYPNPNNGQFTLNFDIKVKENTEIKIYDVSGKEVYTENLQQYKGVYSKRIDLTTEKSGTYFIQIIQNNKILTKKFILN